MQTMWNMRWQDVIELILGVWLAFSPWTLGFSDMEAATWNAVVLGAAIGIFALLEMGLPRIWEEWISLAMGLWLVASPFVLGFSSHAVASWSTLATGVMIAVFAAWAMSLDKEIGKWWDRHVTGH